MAMAMDTSMDTSMACSFDNQTGVENIMAKLQEIAKYVPSDKGEINNVYSQINDIFIKNGMTLRSGRVLGGKKGRKYKNYNGGMPPRKSPPAQEVEASAAGPMEGIASAAGPIDIVAKIDSLPLDEKKELLNAIAHIIAAGTITGGGAALLCSIIPAIEVYLVSMNVVPKLCTASGVVGMAEWLGRSVIAPLSQGAVDSCMDIQERYNLIMTQIITVLGLPTIGAVIKDRTKIINGYSRYKNFIYNGLMAVTNLFKPWTKPAEVLHKNTETLNKLIVDLANFAKEIEPGADVSKFVIEEQTAIKEFSEQLSKQEAEYYSKNITEPSDTSDWPENYGMETGGKRRGTRRKHKAHRTHRKRRTSGKRKTGGKRKTHIKRGRKSKKY